MRLDLGGLEELSDPTPDQVAHYLRYMPVESPFINLQRCEGQFIQAVIEEGHYRVEYREQDAQWFVKTDYKNACELFWCFMDESCELANETKWTRLTALNTPWHPLAVILLIFLIVAGMVLGVCVEFGLL